ncbi:MAG: hypothetical protein KJ574_00695 [Nanoarchaeota archaeon]|nr:hypothetical protein [Nanoarchaeota archaeon]
MGLSLRQSIELRQELKVALPPTNWSLVEAFKEEGDDPLFFKKNQLDVADMPLEQRLAAVDNENEVFRFAYTQAEGDDGKKGRFYKIPLMRDFNVDIEDIKIRITKAEYQRATAVLNGAGRFQRIARAVPYSQLHADVKDFVEKQGFPLDDVVVVGVDRGGRLPSFIMREALGKDEGYTLKVDQAGGESGELDRDRLDEMIEKGILKGKFALFVDSTVDSGRQIEVLRRYFDNEEWKAKIGHKEWGVVGSNEDGETLYKHRNINWGLNPDESFEDKPELMGVDYADESNTKVVDCPSETSEAIKEALLEVPRGVVLDLSGLEGLLNAAKMRRKVDKVLSSRTWQRCEGLYWSDDKKALGVPTAIIPAIATEELTPSRKLLVVGSGGCVDLTDAEAEYIAAALSPFYNVIGGTPGGNPGRILEEFSRRRSGSAQLYQPRYANEDYESKNMFGNQIVFHGETKREFRENLAQSGDAILVLSGGKGTLQEVIFGLAAERPTYIITGYGAVGTYASRSRFLKKFPSLFLVDCLPSAVDELTKRQG